MATRTTKRADNANRPGRPPSRLKCGTRHLKLYESRDILGAAQGSPRDARSGLEPGRSSQVPAIASIWFTGRRSAQIRSRSPRATGHWRAVRWIYHRLDPAHGQSASFSNKTDPPRTPGQRTREHRGRAGGHRVHEEFGRAGEDLIRPERIGDDRPAGAEYHRDGQTAPQHRPRRRPALRGAARGGRG